MKATKHAASTVARLQCLFPVAECFFNAMRQNSGKQQFGTCCCGASPLATCYRPEDHIKICNSSGSKQIVDTLGFVPPLLPLQFWILPPNPTTLEGAFRYEGLKGGLGSCFLLFLFKILFVPNSAQSCNLQRCVSVLHRRHNALLGTSTEDNACDLQCCVGAASTQRCVRPSFVERNRLSPVICSVAC